MSEGDIEAAASYSDAARARLMMAYEACELSDLARAAVPAGEPGPNRDGATGLTGTTGSAGAALADAAQVLLAARRFLDAAVVFARTGGATWDTIGAGTGTSAHAAHRRFAMAEARFRQALCSEESARDTGVEGDFTWWRSHMIREPLEAALDLDDWVLRHKDGDEHPGIAPVSRGLGAGTNRPS